MWNDDLDVIAGTSPVSVDRRTLLRRTGTGAGAVALGSMATAAGLAPTPARAQAIDDAAVVNFALNLEYLEAEFYVRAVTGQGLAAADTTGGNGVRSGGVIGGHEVPFRTPAIQQYAREVARDELAHVRLLRSVLGSNAAPEPHIDLENSFNTLAQAAGLGSSFNPYADEYNFLLGAYIFEDVGVTAYHGAATLIQSKDVLSVAAGILGVEAYHASLVRTQLLQFGYRFQSATESISALRAKLSQAADDQGVLLNGDVNIVPSDANGIAFSRTTRQVLNIVYGAVDAKSGLFFPDGLSGQIR